MDTYRDEIIRLRKEGKTYKEITELTGASKGTISYYCDPDGKTKNKQRQRALRGNPIFKKSETFQCRKNAKSVENRLDHFQRKSNAERIRSVTFHWTDVIAKFGIKTICYLTGRPIDLNEPRTYSFDHIVPGSKGGDNSIDNLGIACIAANQSKTDLSIDEYVQLCKEVLEHRGYTVTCPNAAQVGVEPTSDYTSFSG